ncbi:MAG: RodZ domain-containing protein [Candidatus Binatia bacterium]
MTASHLLKVRAKEKTWLRVSIDGQQPPKDVLLEPGQETEWSAQQGFVLTLGNAGGIHITLDGEDLPPPGKPGQVIRDLRLPAPPGATPQAIPVIIPVTTSVATSVVTPAASSPPQKRPSPPKVKVRDEATDLQRILDGLKRVRKDIRG